MDESQANLFDVSLSRVSDGDYFRVALELIRASRRRCLVDMFIVDYDLRHDPMARLDQLMIELAAAEWRGVEVKLLVGGSRKNGPILEAALLAVARAQQLGLEARLAAGREGNDSHAKLVIADDSVLSGSHNWSRGAFAGQVQDSVWFEHEAMSASLADYFSQQWQTASEDALDVSL